MSDVPTSLMRSDSLALSSAFGAPQWGIWSATGGQQILEANSVLSVEYARDYNVSDYPQEQGAFQSYNKVTIPYLAKITFIITDTRVRFLSRVEDAVKSLEFVTVITPEKTYPSANLTHYDYRRQKENQTLVDVTVWCREVRLAGQTQLTNTATGATNIGASTQTGSLNGAGTSQGGAVQSASAADASFATPAPPDLSPPT